MPHSAPQGFSMVLAGPSRHLWLCLLCFVCLVLPCMPCMPCSIQRFRRCYFESISAHASGTALGLNPAGDPVFRNHAQDSQQACCFTSVSVEPLNNFSFKKSCPCKANALSCSFLSLPLLGLHNLRACSSLVWPPFLRLPL